ncbi:MAG: hypothetical protein JW797_17985 [Bradymonadales bacterium]|nr:hypothetical protein [Bradymonadales bacterium]
MARDLGDFQTPPDLVRAVLDRILSRGHWFARVLEPTCGTGNFIADLLGRPHPPREMVGIEIQSDHLSQARGLLAHGGPTQLSLLGRNLFDLDLRREIAWTTGGELLVVGNPPWVTNSELGALGSENRPTRSNRRGIRGIEAMTGESNFDLAEAIWIKLLEELAGQRPTLAMLCKSTVARRVLKHAQQHRIGLAQVALYEIDSRRWFGASTAACLFTCRLTGDSPNGHRAELPPDLPLARGQRPPPTAASQHWKADIYPDLEAEAPKTLVGLIEGRWVADLEAYEETRFLDGDCPITWRQGIKHDAAEVMELIEDERGMLSNGLGERIEVENGWLYPLLKGSDLFHNRLHGQRRRVIVTQTRLGQETISLQHEAPRLWEYLCRHRSRFDRRRSSIYRGQPPFALFGIGQYAFAGHKVAVSGLHAQPRFRWIPPANERPVMLDDTCYYLPCRSQAQAALVTGLLNHPTCLGFLDSLLFRDAKRPVTKRLLQRIDLKALIRHLGPDQTIGLALAQIHQVVPDPENLDLGEALWQAILDLE